MIFKLYINKFQSYFLIKQEIYNVISKNWENLLIKTF